MRTKTRVVSRVLIAVGVCCTVTATAFQPAGAVPTAGPPRPVVGVASPSIYPDPTCPSDPEFPNGNGPRRLLIGVVQGFGGRSVLRMNLCYVFIGALGGQRIIGRFDLVGRHGTLRGPVNGTVGFSQSDQFRLVLRVERGTGHLEHLRGTLAFAGGAGRDGGWLPLENATLSPSLSRVR